MASKAWNKDALAAEKALGATVILLTPDKAEISWPNSCRTRIVSVYDEAKTINWDRLWDEGDD